MKQISECLNIARTWLKVGSADNRSATKAPDSADCDHRASVTPTIRDYMLFEQVASSSELAELAERLPEFFTDDTEDVIRRHCEVHGIASDFQGRVLGDRVAILGDEMREHLLVDGLNSRQRAVAELLIHFLAERGISESAARIYGHEGVTPLAGALRGRFLRFLGSEYAPTHEQQEWLWPIPHADVCALDFPDQTFDAIVSCDVFEHVPNLDAALSEAARVLRPGGRLFATFPFHWYSEETLVYATIENGELKHHLEPIYHGNPVDADGGSLVFQIPGWDVIERAKNAGFSRASMTLYCSQLKGIVASSRLEPMRPKGVFITAFDR